MYTIEQAMAIVNSNTGFIVFAALMTYGLGFWCYLTSMYMQIKNKECPFYFWHHCWYFGHDFTFACLFNMWWNEIGFWLFKVLNIGCMLFCVIEFVSLYYAVKYERNWNWGKYFRSGKVTEKQGWIMGLTGYAMGVVMFATIRKMIGDPMCFCLMSSTLVIFGLTLRFNTKERKYINHGSKMLGIAAFFQVLFCFMPPGVGFFTTIVPSMHQPAWYILGFFMILSTLDFVRLTWTLPMKDQYLAEGGPIIYKEDWETETA